MLAFPNRIVFIGFGSVARCTLPILFKHVAIPPERVTIVDFDPEEDVLAPWLAQGRAGGAGPDRARLPRPDPVGRRLAAGDVLIDLAWNIDTGEIVQWCHDHGVLYLNTAVELWDPYDVAPAPIPTEADALLPGTCGCGEIVAGWTRAGPDGRGRARGQSRA